jgi:hypothetical protein
MKGNAANRARRENGRVARIGYTRLYATASGLLLVVIGLAGFVENPEFTDPELWSELFGFYAVNGWANALHVATGLLALLLARSLSRLWALIAFAGFTGLGLWGVLAPNATLLFGVLPAERSVNALNLALGGLALLALLASRWDRISNAAGIWERRVRESRVRRKRRKQEKLKRERIKRQRTTQRKPGSKPGS